MAPFPVRSVFHAGIDASRNKRGSGPVLFLGRVGISVGDSGPIDHKAAARGSHASDLYYLGSHRVRGVRGAFDFQISPSPINQVFGLVSNCGVTGRNPTD